MATGTGKTWVLIALLVWQYFNAQNHEKPRDTRLRSEDWYSNRFLLVSPGREVLDRLLSFSEVEIEVEVEQELLRPLDVPLLVGKHVGFTDATGWEASIPLDRTLKDLLDYWRAQPHQ